MTKTKIGSITERTKKKQNHLIGNLALCMIVCFQRRNLNLTKSWIRVMCRRRPSQGKGVGVAGGEGKERDPGNEVVCV